VRFPGALLSAGVTPSHLCAYAKLSTRKVRASSPELTTESLPCFRGGVGIGLRPYGLDGLGLAPRQGEKIYSSSFFLSFFLSFFFLPPHSEQTGSEADPVSYPIGRGCRGTRKRERDARLSTSTAFCYGLYSVNRSISFHLEILAYRLQSEPSPVDVCSLGSFHFLVHPQTLSSYTAWNIHILRVMWFVAFLIPAVNLTP
jgi:hypothetical protein